MLSELPRPQVAFFTLHAALCSAQSAFWQSLLQYETLRHLPRRVSDCIVSLICKKTLPSAKPRSTTPLVDLLLSFIVPLVIQTCVSLIHQLHFSLAFRVMTTSFQHLPLCGRSTECPLVSAPHFWRYRMILAKQHIPLRRRIIFGIGTILNQAIMEEDEEGTS